MATLALDRIDPASGLRRLLDHGESGAIARRTFVLGRLRGRHFVLPRFTGELSEKSSTQIETVCHHEQRDKQSGAAKQCKLLEKLAVR
jgi:hypothetical protein